MKLKLYIVFCCFFTMGLFNPVKAQYDINIKISEAEINNALAALVEAHGLNFGDYVDSTILDSWFVNVDAATVDILPNNQVQVNVDVVVVAEIDVWLFTFSVVKHLSGSYIGNFVVIDDQQNGFQLKFVSYYNTFSSFLSVVWSLLPDIEINLGTFILPQVVQNFFTTQAPYIQTTQDEIILGYNVAGPREITIKNDFGGNANVSTFEVKNEQGVWETWASPRKFYWELNSQHDARAKDGLVSYNNSNWKFKWWNGSSQQMNLQRTITADGDKTEEIDFGVVHSLTVQTNLLEGGTGGKILYEGQQKNSPFSDYGFQSPFATNIGVNNPQQINGHYYYLQNWQDGNTLANRTIFLTAPSTYTAYLKGTQLSNQTDAYNSNSQRKAVRLENSNYLLNVYKSLNHKIWLEQSDNNGQSWFLKSITPIDDDPFNEYSSPAIDYIPQLGGSHPFAAIVHNILRLSIFRDNYSGKYYYQGVDANLSYNATYITPVVATTSSRILIVFNNGLNQSGQEGLGYIYGTLSYTAPSTFTVNWTDGQSPQYKIIPGTNYESKNISIVADKNTSNVFHIVWEQNNTIKYCKATGSGNSLTFSSVETVSASSPYQMNKYPSISLANSKPIVSWTAGGNMIITQKQVAKENALTVSRTIIRIKVGSVWSDMQIVGNNVNFTNNNSATNSNENTVIVWSEGSTNPQSKWINRTDGIYSQPSNLSHNGIQTQVIHGNDYNNMTSLVFNNNQQPYYFTKTTTSFLGIPLKISKVNNPNDTLVTFGRAGVVNNNGVNFVFNMGDIIVDNNIISFIEKPDTIVYNTYEELNQFTKTEPFELNPNSLFYFSNLYYVVNSENADTLLTENDNINFRVELVRVKDGNVVGKFDNIDYNKSNLSQYANISYQVDCSGIESEEYYLRLVTTSAGSSSYTLANIMNESTILEKTSGGKTISFTGSEQIATYDLSQNYPNPFNPTTTINYQIPKPGFVSLKVYDILGREVAILVNGEKEMGKYTVQFDGSKLASGVYIYEIRANEFVSVKKLMLLK